MPCLWDSTWLPKSQENILKAIKKYKKFTLNLIKISYYFLLLNIFYYFLPKSLRKQYSDRIKIHAQKILKFFNPRIFNLQAFNPRSFILWVFNRNKKTDVLLVEDLGIIIKNSNGLLLSHLVERKSKISSPKLYVGGVWYRRPQLSGKLSDVKTAKLKSVNVLGATDAIIYGDRFFHDELNLMSSQHDLKRPDIFSFKHNDSVYTINTFCRSSIKNGKVLSLLKEHSINYYHWVTELIPKLLQMLKSLTREDKRVYVLVDEGMPKQCLELLELLLQGSKIPRYKIFKVKHGESVHCQELIYCTPLWTALDNTTHLPNPKKEFFLSIDNLKQVKEEVRRKFEGKKFSMGSKKLYLQSKNNRLRKLLNIVEVEALLHKQGFDFVDPGALSFEAQFELFSQAEIIIGNSGAAFTNLLFMKEGSTAIALYPSVESTNYYIFQPLADASQVELIHFLTKPVTESKSVHGDALVDITGLSMLLEEIKVW